MKHKPRYESQSPPGVACSVRARPTFKPIRRNIHPSKGIHHQPGGSAKSTPPFDGEPPLAAMPPTRSMSCTVTLRLLLALLVEPHIGNAQSISENAVPTGPGHPLEASARPPPATWATLLSGNDVNMSLNAQVQVLSVQSFSKHPHLTMVTPDVSTATRSRLQELGSLVLEVEQIVPPVKIARPYWSSVFTKLRVFELSAHAEHVAFLDNDVLLTTSAADSVFGTCTAELCGVRDGSTADGKPMLNAGLLVVRPSAARFEQLLTTLAAARSIGTFPEQQFLADFFRAVAPGGEFGRRVQELDGNYNTCSRSWYERDGQLIYRTVCTPWTLVETKPEPRPAQAPALRSLCGILTPSMWQMMERSFTRVPNSSWRGCRCAPTPTSRPTVVPPVYAPSSVFCGWQILATPQTRPAAARMAVAGAMQQPVA